MSRFLRWTGLGRVRVGFAGYLALAACSSESRETPRGDAAFEDSGIADDDSGMPATGGRSQGSGGQAGSSGGTPSGSGGSADDGGDVADASTGGADASIPEDVPDVDRTDPQLHEFTLDPALLDPSADDYLADQFAQLDTRSAPLGKLVFFLPGANNSPGDWRNHGRKLAEFGFHVVIPHYNNAWGDACSGQGGSCNADTRWEALTGEDTSSVVDISRANSAEGRVLAMLMHLRQEHPGGDWGYYLAADDSLRGERVIIAGISHGATSSGLFASRRAFARVVMHSGGYGAIGDAPATPVDRYYGLSHTEDPQHDAHLASWESANLPGSPVSIDGRASPFDGTHRLITSEESSYPHCSVVVHSSSPTDSGGAYLFEPAWRYMYGL